MASSRKSSQLATKSKAKPSDSSKQSFKIQDESTNQTQYATPNHEAGNCKSLFNKVNNTLPEVSEITQGKGNLSKDSVIESLLSQEGKNISKAKKAPPITSVTRNTPTPTKQIVLEAVKRKEESAVPFDDSVHKAIASQVVSKQNRSTKQNSMESARISSTTEGDGNGDNGEISEDSSSSDEESVKAPNELLMEFLECVMKGDYNNGLKLCNMILIYEPTNTNALNFKSLIEEKISIDASKENLDDEDGDDVEEEEEEEESDSETDSDSSEADADSTETSEEDDQ